MGTARQVARTLSRIITPRTEHQAMERACLILDAAAKREAPVKKGDLRRRITYRVEQSGKRGVVGTNAPHARPVHEGSKAHIIRPKNGKALAFTIGGVKIIRASVKHPGNRPNRFFERAITSSRDAVLRELQAVYGDAVEA